MVVPLDLDKCRDSPQVVPSVGWQCGRNGQGSGWQEGIHNDVSGVGELPAAGIGKVFWSSYYGRYKHSCEACPEGCARMPAPGFFEGSANRRSVVGRYMRSEVGRD